MKEIEEEASEPIDSESISPFQAKFNFNVIDKKYLVMNSQV